MYRCASWEAVSSKTQAGKDKVSLERQREVNLTAVEKIGGTCVAHLIVPGESRSIVLFEDACKRVEAYRQLRKLVDAKAIDVLVCYTHSRIGREISLCESVIAYCLAGGVAIYDCSAPPSSLDAKEQANNAGDRLRSVIRSWEALTEVNQLIRNNEDGIAKRVRNGLMPGRTPKFYDVQYDPKGDKYLIINEENARVAKQIIDLYLYGLGLESIAERLGLTTPAIRHVINSVRKLAGQVEVNVHSKHKRKHIVAPGKHPAIISLDTMQQVLEERARRHGHSRSVNSSYRYSGIVVCAACNRNMAVNSIKQWADRETGERKKYRVVRCYGCDRNVAFTTVDKAIDKWMQELQLVELGVAHDNTNHDEELRGLVAGLERNQTKRNRLTDLYTNELLDLTEYKERIVKLQQEASNLQQTIDELSNQVPTQASKVNSSNLLEYLKEFRSTLPDNELNQFYKKSLRVYFGDKRELIVKLLVDKI